MSKIESSIGSVSFDNQQLKKYVVEDESSNSFSDLEEMPPSNFKQTVEKSNNIQEKALLNGRKFIRNSSISEEKELEILEAYQGLKEKKLEPLTQNEKNKLETLLGLRKRELPVIIDGHEFVLSALTALDFKKLTRRIVDKAKDAIDETFEVRNTTLAISLISLDGESISSMIEEGDDIDLETRISIIENMAESLVAELYTFYRENINVIPTSQKEVKEVMSNLKG